MLNTAVVIQGYSLQALAFSNSSTRKSGNLVNDYIDIEVNNIYSDTLFGKDKKHRVYSFPDPTKCQDNS